MIASCKNLIEKCSLLARVTNDAIVLLSVIFLLSSFSVSSFGHVEGKGSVEVEEEEVGES